MQVSVETTNGLERKATITVPSDSFEELVDESVKNAASDLKLPGFRPGKVPLKEVRRRFGPALRQEVAAELSRSSFADAVSQEELSLAGEATIKIERMEAGQDLEYTATFEVLPTIELADMATLKISQPLAQIEEADIDATVESLRRQRVEWHPVERPAAAKDRLHVDLAATMEGGVTSQHEDKTLVLGEDDGRNELHDALMGAVVGETRVFPITLPVPADHDDHDHDHDHGDHDHSHGDHDHSHGHDHDHHDDSAAPAVEADETVAATAPAVADGDAAGVPEAQAIQEPQEAEQNNLGDLPNADDDPSAPDDEPSADEADPSADEAEPPRVLHAVGEATVRSIEEPHLPPVDDEFMEWFGIEAGEDRPARFRAAVRERMELELATALRRATKQQVVSALVNAHDIEVPLALVRAEYQSELARLEQMFNDVPIELKQASLLLARQNACAQLVMREIAAKESVQLDDERVRQRIDEVADSYEESAEVRRYLYGDEEQLRRVEGAVLEEQVLDLVLSRAKHVDVQMPYQDVISGKAVPPPEDSPDDASDESEGTEAETASTAEASPDMPAEQPEPDEARPGSQPQAKPSKGGFLRRFFNRP